MRIWITADVHHGMGAHPELTERLARWCLERAEPGDALVLAGDLACGDARGLAALFAAFAGFPGPRAFVPGNHDLWSRPDEGPGSLRLYEEVLPALGQQHGFAMLDTGPVRVPQDSGAGAGRAVALAGSYGGYDFSLAPLGDLPPAARQRVRAGWRSGVMDGLRWNDYVYMWRGDGRPWDHAALAAGCVARLDAQLQALEADPEVGTVVCVTHTAATREQVQQHPLARRDRPELERWFLGLSGAAGLGAAIRRSPKTRLAVCGHTHHAREHTDAEGRRWINLGCEYRRKRWLTYEPASGTLTYGTWIA
ncbi:MAG: hypothetical protein KatS3mg102_1907 [Planctomycetota bacterium]|nr:MAG: hypothetical protein KatS3mg102_1907 [Planctomycetota bacterium]